METNMLIRKGIIKHFGTLFAITILLFLIFFLSSLAITIYQNAGNYVEQELDRLGYGDITAWVSEVNNLEDLETEIERVDNVQRVEIQNLIFSGYSINGIHSDNEGQLLNYEENKKYHILNNNMTGYKEIDRINQNEIYISPSMMSSFNVKLGDTIEFEISRNGEKKTFTVAGFFEDGFMGSSMIDMKSFLISNEDFEEIANQIQNTNTDNLARIGAMLHIYQNEDTNLNVNNFNMQINSHTNLSNYTEFVYTRDTIYDFMMILANIFMGFLISFVIILLIVTTIIIAHSISNTIDNDRKDLGILKTIGFTNKKLRTIQIIQYLTCIIFGIIFSITAITFWLDNISSLLITSTGFIMPSNLPIIACILAFVIVSIILIAVIVVKTSKISKIAPIEIIRGEESINAGIKTIGEIDKKGITISIAIRQLLSGKKKYIGIFVISILLTFFALIVTRLDSWVGKNGEGLMNAFSVANHDIGVQPLVHVDMNVLQNEIEKDARIEDVYALAMQDVSVNGVDYTANVINDENWFHILQGRTCQNEDEIVITDTVASELTLKIGDTVTINNERLFEEYEIVGIYQCANEMGANIGMSREGYSRIGDVNSYIWCYHFILDNSNHNEEIMKNLQNKYPMQMDVHTNSWSGLDGIVSTMRLLVVFMYVIVIILILIVVGLTTSKLLSSEKRDMGIYKVIGITSKKLRISFALRFFILSIIGGLIGVICSIFFADRIILELVRNFGIGEFISRISFTNVMIPVVIITMVFTLSAYILSRKIEKVSSIDLIKE